MAKLHLNHDHDDGYAEDERLSREAEEAMHAGVGISLSELVAWVECWGTDAELPPPPARKVI